MLLFNTKATEKTTNFQYNFLKFVDPCNKNLRTILQQIKYPEVVAQFMTDHWVNNKNITTGVPSNLSCLFKSMLTCCVDIDIHIKLKSIYNKNMPSHKGISFKLIKQ